MCKFNPKNDSRRIDPCMDNFIDKLNWFIDRKKFDVRACCCGHSRYPMTVVIRAKVVGWHYELFSGVSIPRSRNFYKKDSKGYYYIPEVSKERK